MNNPLIGTIIMFGGNFAPRGWAFCDGQLMDISQNTALFSILGTTYGGDGRRTFGLPDFRSRLPVGEGNGPGLSSRPLGQKSGVENVTLNLQQMPSHNHLADASTLTVNVGVVNGGGNTNAPGGAHRAEGSDDIYSSDAADATLGGVSAGGTLAVGNTGNNQPHSNIQPYTVVNYIIALTGLYPSRS